MLLAGRASTGAKRFVLRNGCLYATGVQFHPIRGDDVLRESRCPFQSTQIKEAGHAFE
jgi:hypothetical protein